MKKLLTKPILHSFLILFIYLIIFELNYFHIIKIEVWSLLIILIFTFSIFNPVIGIFQTKTKRYNILSIIYLIILIITLSILSNIASPILSQNTLNLLSLLASSFVFYIIMATLCLPLRIIIQKNRIRYQQKREELEEKIMQKEIYEKTNQQK